MQTKTVVCQQCGQKAILKETSGLLKPDSRFPGVRVLQTIDCPDCGSREQPDDRIPTITENGQPHFRPSSGQVV